MLVLFNTDFSDSAQDFLCLCLGQSLPHTSPIFSLVNFFALVPRAIILNPNIPLDTHTESYPSKRCSLDPASHKTGLVPNTEGT